MEERKYGCKTIDLLTIAETTILWAKNCQNALSARRSSITIEYLDELQYKVSDAFVNILGVNNKQQLINAHNTDDHNNDPTPPYSGNDERHDIDTRNTGTHTSCSRQEGEHGSDPNANLSHPDYNLLQYWQTRLYDARASTIHHSSTLPGRTMSTKPTT